MSSLIERYVQEMGRYLPARKRAAIIDELRSQIHDQLEDRYGRDATPEQVTQMLAGMGYPYLMAREYAGDRALLGPLVYPFVLPVLRRVWGVIPAIALFLAVLGAVTTPGTPPLEVLWNGLWGGVQAAINLSALIVVVFHIMERLWIARNPQAEPFNPHDLPEVDNPRAVDRTEAVFGIVISGVVIVVALAWARTGGLTLGVPGEIIPAPSGALLVLAGIVLGMLLVNAWALARGRWSALMLLGQTALEIGGVLCLYFALWQPITLHLMAADPALAEQPIVAQGAVWLTAIGGILNLISGGRRLIRLLE